MWLQGVVSTLPGSNITIDTFFLVPRVSRAVTNWQNIQHPVRFELVMQTRDIEQMLQQYWASVVDFRPTSQQQLVNVLCSLVLFMEWLRIEVINVQLWFFLNWIIFRQFVLKIVKNIERFQNDIFTQIIQANGVEPGRLIWICLQQHGSVYNKNIPIVWSKWKRPFEVLVILIIVSIIVLMCCYGNKSPHAW